jgi:Flp pilus assembly pilin Flp
MLGKTDYARDDSGQTLVEYALIIVLVAVALVGALAALQGGLTAAYATIVAAL